MEICFHRLNGLHIMSVAVLEDHTASCWNSKVSKESPSSVPCPYFHEIYCVAAELWWPCLLVITRWRHVKVTNWLPGDSISLVVIHHNALPWATRECNSLRLRHRQHKNRQCEWMRLQLWVKFNFNILSKQSIDSIGKVTVQRKKEKQKTNWLDVIGHTSEERLKATLTQLMCLEGLEMSIIRLI